MLMQMPCFYLRSTYPNKAIYSFKVVFKVLERKLALLNYCCVTIMKTLN